MPKFKFWKHELTHQWWCDTYIVEANTKEEALRLIKDDIVDPCDTTPIFQDPQEIDQTIILDSNDNEVYNALNESTVDNSDWVRDRIGQLTDEHHFVWVQVIQRKKDGNELPAYTSGARVLRSFCFFEKRLFNRDLPYIRQLCEQNNARAYVWVNPKDTREIACETAKHLIELIQQGNTQQSLRIWDRECGKNYSKAYEKYWILDFDTEDQDLIDKYITIINECRGSQDRIKHKLKTLHGWHYLCTGFDREQFYQKLKIAKLDPIDIHPNSPSLMYYLKK